LAYWNLQLLDDLGTIIDEDPHIHFTMSADVLLFCPKQRDKLLGRVNKVGMDHIGLLVFGVFNATIPNDSIPSMYSRDMENDCWIRSAPDGSSVTITDGTLLTFTVNSVEIFHHDIASIVGSLLEVGTGPLNFTLQADEIQVQNSTFDHERKTLQPVKANDTQHDNKLSPIHQPKKLKSSKQSNQMDNTSVDVASEDNLSTHDTSNHTTQSTSKLKLKPSISSPTSKVTSNKQSLSKKSQSTNLIVDTSPPTDSKRPPTKKRKVE